MQKSDQILKAFRKLSNDAVQELIKWHEKEYPDFPAEDDVEKFLKAQWRLQTFMMVWHNK